MKFKTFFALVFAFCILFSATVSSGGENVIQKFPCAFLPADSYEFAPVVDGVMIMHDFVIQNKGDAPLKILKIKTGWGCAAVSYTRQIPPGGEGKITIKVNSSGYGGRRLKKSIAVQTNDIKHPRLNLTIFGNVEKFASIVPKSIVLRGAAGKRLSGSATIIPEEKYPFKIVETTAKIGENINYKLEEIKRSKRSEYLLTVENLKKTKGRYFDVIILKTTSKIRPEIKIKVYGNIVERWKLKAKGSKQELNLQKFGNWKNPLSPLQPFRLVRVTEIEREPGSLWKI